MVALTNLTAAGRTTKRTSTVHERQCKTSEGAFLLGCVLCCLQPPAARCRLSPRPPCYLRPPSASSSSGGMSSA